MLQTLVRWSVVAVLVTGCAKKEQPKPGLETGPIIAAVNFDSGSTTIPASEMVAVDKAVQVQKNGDWKVLLVGLADGSGDPETNKVISQQRADVVAKELVSRGVPEEKITTHAVGERLADSEDDVLERKVEFVFYKRGANMTPRQIAIESGAMASDYHDRPKAK